eukprot:251187-Chlamydomonas_euryale.AAC.3
MGCRLNGAAAGKEPPPEGTAATPMQRWACGRGGNPDADVGLRARRFGKECGTDKRQGLLVASPWCTGGGFAASICSL